MLAPNQIQYDVADQIHQARQRAAAHRHSLGELRFRQAKVRLTSRRARLAAAVISVIVAVGIGTSAAASVLADPAGEAAPPAVRSGGGGGGLTLIR